MRAALRLVLLGLGHAMALASRVSPHFRRQVTRDRCLVISSDDGVCVSFLFDARTRRMSVSEEPGAQPDCALRFTSAAGALRTLLHPRSDTRMVEGVRAGTVRIEGAAPLVMWFQGLIAVITPAVRLRRRRPLPVRPQRPDRSAPHAHLITVEPAVDALPPQCTAAWRARGKLLQVRVPAGEVPPPG